MNITRKRTKQPCRRIHRNTGPCLYQSYRGRLHTFHLHVLSVLYTCGQEPPFGFRILYTFKTFLSSRFVDYWPVDGRVFFWRWDRWKLKRTFIQCQSAKYTKFLHVGMVGLTKLCPVCLVSIKYLLTGHLGNGRRRYMYVLKSILLDFFGFVQNQEASVHSRYQINWKRNLIKIS